MKFKIPAAIKELFGHAPIVKQPALVSSSISQVEGFLDIFYAAVTEVTEVTQNGGRFDIKYQEVLCPGMNPGEEAVWKVLKERAPDIFTLPAQPRTGEFGILSRFWQNPDQIRDSKGKLMLVGKDFGKICFVSIDGVTVLERDMTPARSKQIHRALNVAPPAHT